MTTASQSPAFRALALGPYEGSVERRDDGSFILRSTQPLGAYPRSYSEPLERWARERPDAWLVAKRGPDGAWTGLSYARALELARRLGQALLDRGLGPERPLMILSGNDLEHAALGLAAAYAGVPYVPVSPAYSLLSQGCERVRHAVELTTPGLVFASDAGPFANAIAKAVPAGTELVFTRGGVAGRSCTSFEALAATEPTAAVQRAREAVNGDTILKFLFTSGSTKLPKAVINTHGMMCSNQVMQTQCYPYLMEAPPVLVDWLPWHHTAGGNADFGLVLFHGGTMYIDDGKPTPDAIGETLRNLREISTTVYYTVPKGLDFLAHAMKTDAVLRERFFNKLRLIFPAGAALPPALKRTIDEMAVQTCGARIPMTMGLGMTESAPFAISAHLPDWQAGVIGLPAPGVDVKLAPVGDKLEVRYRGPSITPGYWRQPELTREAFDEEGFFRSGDGARFLDDAAPERGLRFDGRIAEDFKLASGTWANIGALRIAMLNAGQPYIQDVVLTGADRDYLGMLVFLLPAAHELCRPGVSGELAAMAADPQLRAWLQGILDAQAAAATGSSQRICRAIVLEEPPSMDRGEMTDKGSINQQAVLKCRAALVEALYADAPGPEVLVAASTRSKA